MLSSILPALVVLIALVGDGRYIISILKGKTKPSFDSFFIFTIEMSVVFFASYSLGARDSLVLIGTFVLINFVMTLLSLKYGYVSFSKFNSTCLALSLVGILLWMLTDNAWYALLLETVVDMIGFIIVARKVFICPGTEEAFAWGMSALAYAGNLLLITSWVPQEYLFSLSNVVWCAVVFLLSLRKTNT